MFLHCRFFLVCSGASASLCCCFVSGILVFILFLLNVEFPRYCGFYVLLCVCVCVRRVVSYYCVLLSCGLTFIMRPKISRRKLLLLLLLKLNYSIFSFSTIKYEISSHFVSNYM